MLRANENGQQHPRPMVSALAGAGSARRRGLERLAAECPEKGDDVLDLLVLQPGRELDTRHDPYHLGQIGAGAVVEPA